MGGGVGRFTCPIMCRGRFPSPTLLPAGPASGRTGISRGARHGMATDGRRFLIALDFDGVLVDSAQETALSGFHAAKALWPGAGWLTRRLRRPDQMAALVQNFEAIRPCLETGWESTILLHLKHFYA